MGFDAFKLQNEMIKVLKEMNYDEPTQIQKKTIPVILKKKDILAISKTGTGKTLAFVIPIINSLLKKPRSFHSIIMTPTRELALQIKEVLISLGCSFGIEVALLIGGDDMVIQTMNINRKPHVIVGTPGRIVDHLDRTKKFCLSKTKMLVLDEADKLLEMDFENEIKRIKDEINEETQILLFSATMTKKVENISKITLNQPSIIQLSSKYDTVDLLQQKYLFLPLKFKETFLYFILVENKFKKIIIFVNSCSNCKIISKMLEELNFDCVSLFGEMKQEKRTEALNIFKSKDTNILVSTDVSSRGMDIPEVECVLNYDVPENGKDYIHRIGRTARAGAGGLALTFVTQYDLEKYQKIEHIISKRLESYNLNRTAAETHHEKISKLIKTIYIELKDLKNGKKKIKK
ncbi:DEAD/DEAH box helicase [Hamiltosporidium tvaerminnensis]|uniref:DEAD/DEAH box helicase n=1 Tax=Hamiltosporidium tvaerminnensis TaxID=1176355 RepID=A0A4V6MVA1_9MICR|nr:hypothetical protein LUQ84_000308 [Hamiltosporidium tvaerminnensis]TBU00182.1 DEAD/DEAH box helicase [Hamiltosporidium tvaerminnensis]